MSRRQFVLIAFLFALSGLANLAMTAAQVPADSVQGEYVYEVVGETRQQPNVTRVLSQTYNSAPAAINRMHEIDRDHRPGGKLHGDSFQPIRLRVIKRSKNGGAPKAAGDLLAGKLPEAGGSAKDMAARMELAYVAINKLRVALSQQQEPVTEKQVAGYNSLVSRFNHVREQFAAGHADENKPFLEKYPAMSQMSVREFSQPSAAGSAPQNASHADPASFRDVVGRYQGSSGPENSLTISPEGKVSIVAPERFIAGGSATGALEPTERRGVFKLSTGGRTWFVRYFESIHTVYIYDNAELKSTEAAAAAFETTDFAKEKD